MINIVRSQPAPLILETEKQKKSGSYRCDEVIDRLKEDFFGKCYICGDQGSTTLNIEHRIPHKGDLDLKFSWDNLYWACGHCNNIKGDRYQPLLDCTNPNDNIGECIKFHPNLFPKERPQFESLNDDEATRNTIQLLEDVFNGETTLKKLEAEQLRNRLLNEIKDFQDLLIQFYDEQNQMGTAEREMIRDRIVNHLSAESAFTGFKRSIALKIGVASEFE